VIPGLVLGDVLVLVLADGLVKGGCEPSVYWTLLKIIIGILVVVLVYVAITGSLGGPLVYENVTELGPLILYV
jgi:hypothetical protein